MAINLNPGADTGLVSAATKAGLASAPPSYAATFESVSANYHNTMMSSAKMWGDIASAGVSMYGTYKANQLQDKAEGKGFAEKQKYLDEAREIRRKVARLNNMPDPQSRKQLTDLERQQQNLYNFADNLAEGYAGLNTAMQNADENNVQPYDMEQALAVQGLFNSTGPTERGNYIVSEENENGGKDLVMYHDPKFVTAKNIIPLGVASPQGMKGSPVGEITSFGTGDLYIETTADLQQPVEKKHADLDELSGKPILGMDGEKIKIDLDRLTKSIIPKDKGRALQNTEDKRLQGMAAFGIDSGTLNPTRLAKLGDDIDDLISAYGKQAWVTPSVHSTSGDGRSMSFKGEYLGVDNNGNPTPTRVSAEGFASLSPQYLKKIGVKDIPGTQKGLDIEDFQSSDNYLRLTQAMFNPGDPNYSEAQTNKIFKDYKMQQSKNIVAETWKNSPKNQFNQQATGGLSFLPANKNQKSQIKGDKGVYTPNSAINEIAMLVQPDANGNRQNIKIQGKDDMYVWDKTKQTYMYGKDVIPGKDSLFANVFGEEFTPLNILPLYNSIEDWNGWKYVKEKKEEENSKGKKKGNIFTNLFN